MANNVASAAAGALRIGWAHVDITPPRPMLLVGQFHARVSEGVRDPVTATVLALESTGAAADQAVMVSCDLCWIPDELRGGVRARLAGVAGLDPAKVFLSATHTHTGPELQRSPEDGFGGDLGVELDVMSPAECTGFVAERVAGAVKDAWARRAEGGIGFGLGHAVVGRNRRWVSREGAACMYGNTAVPEFSHIEGWEDHSVNLLYTWARDRRLTGVVVNLACPSQCSESEYQVSADYWHDARIEIGRRLGSGTFVLGQCSAAGDQSPHPIVRKAAEARMLELAGRTPRQEIADRIGAAAERVAPLAERAIDWSPALAHRVLTPSLTRRRLTQADADRALAEARTFRAQADALQAALRRDPSLRQAPRWYVEVTKANRRAGWFEGVALRFAAQQTKPGYPVEAHVVRLGDTAFASNPFEYYLDFGLRIAARSRAKQTFVVQLAGAGSYVPTARAAAGGSYGAIPASTVVGPEGGAELADLTIEAINALWPG